MNIRPAQLMLVTAIPVLLGTLVFILPNQANAAKPFHRIAQAPQPPNLPPDGQQRKPPRIDFAAAAAKLGVTEAKLKDALRVPANPDNPSARNHQRPPRPNFAAAATKYCIS